MTYSEATPQQAAMTDERYRPFRVDVRRAELSGNQWTVTIITGTHGATLSPACRTEAKAQRIAKYLERELAPEQRAEEDSISRFAAEWSEKL